MLIVVEEGYGHEITDPQNFLDNFDMEFSDFPAFRYKNRGGFWVNQTNQMSANMPWRIMQEKGWLIPSGLESRTVEYIKGDFGLRGYYPKGTLARVARETGEKDYRNSVCSLVNTICQRLYLRNADSNQWQELVAKRPTKEADIERILRGIPSAPLNDFERYFQLKKKQGISPQDILSSYAVIQQMEQHYGDILILPSSQKIHPDDPHYDTYSNQIGVKKTGF